MEVGYYFSFYTKHTKYFSEIEAKRDHIGKLGVLKLDLTTSERVLIVLKAFNIVGKAKATFSDILETLIITEDLMGTPSFTITYISQIPVAPLVEGSLDVLEKMALIRKEGNSYLLTGRGDTFLSSKLSNMDALNFLKIAIEVANLKSSRRRMYSLLVIYNQNKFSEKQTEIEKNESLKRIYEQFKKDVRKAIKLTKSRTKNQIT